MKSKLLVAAAFFLCITTAAEAQSIDMTPLCASYAGRPFFFNNSEPVVLSCDQLVAISKIVNFKEPLFRTIPLSVLRLGSVNLNDYERMPPGMGDCKRTTTSSGRLTLQCSISDREVSALVQANTDREGFVIELILLYSDLRPMFQSSARSLKFPGENLTVPVQNLTDQFYFFILDLMIAKDATFASPNLMLERVGTGIRMRLFNLPRTVVPRVEQG